MSMEEGNPLATIERELRTSLVMNFAEWEKHYEVEGIQNFLSE